MKKRMISLLLSFCLVAGLFAGMTATASADGDTWVYTVVAGDTLSKICLANKIDFAKNRDWIVNTNKLKSADVLVVGQKLTLPVAGKVLTWTGSTGTTAAATTLAATTTTYTGGLLAGDSVSYYLYEYSVRSGDTLYNICRSTGADMNTVQKMNNIANANGIRVGQKLMIPSQVIPSSGTYSTVVAHKVVSGDTVQGICTKYGVDFGKNAAKIKGLNNRDNLDAIRVGQTILIPVSNLSASGTAGAVTVSTTSSGGAVVTTSTGAPHYTLNTNKAATNNGTYALTVNGQAVSSASAGQVVHVVTTPDHGYKVSKVSVVKDYNNAAVAVDANNNFVMPACNVRVAVAFEQDYNVSAKAINLSTVNQLPGLTYVVNGYTNATAEPGQTVTIVLPKIPDGYALDKVYVNTVNPQLVAQFTNGTIEPKYFVSVASNLSFKMPAAPVWITILLKAA